MATPWDVEKQGRCWAWVVYFLVGGAFLAGVGYLLTEELVVEAAVHEALKEEISPCTAPLVALVPSKVNARVSLAPSPPGCLPQGERVAAQRPGPGRDLEGGTPPSRGTARKLVIDMRAANGTSYEAIVVFTVVSHFTPAREDPLASPEEQVEAIRGLEMGTRHLYPRAGHKPWPEQAVRGAEDAEKDVRHCCPPSTLPEAAATIRFFQCARRSQTPVPKGVRYGERPPRTAVGPKLRAARVLARQAAAAERHVSLKTIGTGKSKPHR
ncbi:hypothetical protein KFL_003400090 [Klebsormidium nitens]|uniref:Uncharacterized protein n=1 Tax=Klebsormidium nitens TaxID=105231 RepID=A0A1Y1IER0_KLENI|nr:hypothetical protein KFL_003400090 [Klebsormidium nitens]|eukprot:GAQ87236.1 hypothetical protein KFL_003400090 [Klebsormidium nitens]